MGNIEERLPKTERMLALERDVVILQKPNAKYILYVVLSWTMDQFITERNSNFILKSKI